MLKDNIKSHLQLNLIVFIWGFTAVLGDLISIQEYQLVWFRMLLAGVFLSGYLIFTKKSILLPLKSIFKLAFVGFLISIHWIYFFKAINVSNVSITLAIFSTGSFIASILEPFFYKRKVIWYEVLSGLIIIAGLLTIINVEFKYILGIQYALFSVTIGVIFTLFNGKLIKKYDPAVITLYEFLAGVFFITIYLFYKQQFTTSFFQLSKNDWALILLLSSICTAFAFTASVHVMKQLSPYTVMLTTNLEPVYGIFLAYFIIGKSEHMSQSFYIVSIIILATVITNGVAKHYFQDKVN